MNNNGIPSPARPTDLRGGVDSSKELTKAQVKNIQKKAVLSYVKVNSHLKKF